MGDLNMAKYSYEEVKAFIEGEQGNGCKLLSKEYVGYNRLLKVRCSCGHKFEVTFKNFKENNYKTCFNCGIEDRKSPKYREFVQEVKKRDNNTCQCCGEKGNIVHHLNGYSWDIMHRATVSNGVTLCEDCHNKFHYIFGRGENVKEQFFYFKNNKLFKIENISNDIIDKAWDSTEEYRNKFATYVNKVVCIYPNGKVIIKNSSSEMAKYLGLDWGNVGAIIKSNKPYIVTERANYNIENRLKIKGARIISYAKYLVEQGIDK